MYTATANQPEGYDQREDEDNRNSVVEEEQDEDIYQQPDKQVKSEQRSKLDAEFSGKKV